MCKNVQNRSTGIDVKANIIYVPEEHTGENLCNAGLGKNFLGTTEKVWTIKDNLISWTSLK